MQREIIAIADELNRFFFFLRQRILHLALENIFFQKISYNVIGIIRGEIEIGRNWNKIYRYVIRKAKV